MLSVPMRSAFVPFLLAAMSSAQDAPGRSNAASASSVERVCLSEILIRTAESDTAAQIAEAKSKAERVRDAVRLGGAFADLAKANSKGPTASEGGSIGCFKRGQLAKPFEEQIFRMKVSEVSSVLRVKLGFLIVQVTESEPGSSGESLRQTIQTAKASGVRGRVIGGFEHVPIPDAYILVHRDGGTDSHVRTDANGKYAIPLPLGVYDVFISVDGFSPTSRKVEVTPDGMMIFDAVLDFNGLGMEHMTAMR